MRSGSSSMVASTSQRYPFRVAAAGKPLGSARGLILLGALARAGLGLAGRPEARAAVSSLRALGLGSRAAGWRPAALRLERSRLRHAAGRADQTALTLWFGSGPSLPAPGTRLGGRSVVRTAAGVLVAAALGTLAATAARREAARLEEASAVPRLEG